MIILAELYLDCETDLHAIPKHSQHVSEVQVLFIGQVSKCKLVSLLVVDIQSVPGLVFSP